MTRWPDLGSATPRKELVSLADGAADDGFFGPGSVTWRIGSDVASPVAAMRSLLMQALHPLTMSGAGGRSRWLQDPVARLAAVMAYLSTVTFGDRAAAIAALPRWARQLYGYQTTGRAV